MKRNFIKSKKSGRMVTNVWKYALAVVMLMLSVGNMWGHSTHTATLKVEVGTGSGTVYASKSGTATSGSSSVSGDCGGSSDGAHSHTFYAYATPASGYTFLGWTESKTSTTGADASSPKAYTINNGENNVTKTLYAHFVEKAKVNITFIAPTNGTYTIKVNGGSTETVSSSNVVKNNVTDVTLTATPASGYAFAGWYKLNNSGEFVEDISIANPYDASFTVAETIQIGARFVPTTLGKFIIKGSSTQYYGLKAATVAAGGSGIIVPVAEETVVDGSDLMPFDNGSYPIKSGATLLIPYSSANEVQTLPKVVTTAVALSAYRKLILMSGVNIVVSSGAQVCIGGQVMAGSGGKPTGYTTGVCGVLDMSRGGHLELNSGSTLYCWGFVKGQDMEQGNNTTGMGTITVNSSATVWEPFSVGDWRGGSATSDIVDTRFFPFQSYFMQNIEVPTTYWHGSSEWNYFTLNASGGPYDTKFAVIGSSNCLFKLQDANSKVRKWYDPTTDLTCFELSGTAVLDELKITITGLPLIGTININSSEFDLPITSNMHIILTNCNMTLTKPLTVQPGAILEIKNDATVTLATNIYLYDKDEWGPWVCGKYFRSTSNLTTHKNRGDGTSNEYLDDATFIVDGMLTVNSSGKLYSTAGGAAIVGNGGGRLTYPSSLPTSSTLRWYKSTTTSGDGETGTVAVNAANLCNEDGSYTKAIASTTFHNVNGRWFKAADKDPKSNHTYFFTYIGSGAVSGTGGTNTTTDAVYSWDKTGLELRQKWFNVTADGCANWWHGQGEQTTWFYNWTLNSAWHQFMPTATTDLYSGSNNTLYTKTSCTWEELGSTDVNCLYEIGGVKKALVDGQFVALEANNNDPAYHEAEDPTKYYICFAGCNWHEADKYTEVEKAYIIEPDTFIWYNNAWMSVNFKTPFAYTIDETNVPVYYEYVDGEWELAQPYIRVVDGVEDRPYWFLDEAFKFASSVLRTAPTITILRDISGITTAVSYTGANKTCTLNLNGHSITGSVTNMITVNAAGCTFNIVDNTTDKKGKINLVFSANDSRRRALYVQNGHVLLNSGTIASTNTLAYSSSNKKPYAGGVLVANGKQFTLNGGRIDVSSEYNPYGIEGASGMPTININGGTLETVAETKDSPYAIFGYGTINITGGTVNAIAKKSTSAMGVYAYGSASYQSTVNISGGTILARSTESSQGVRCWGSATVTGDYNAETPDNTPKARYYANVKITGGTITAECTTSTKAYGVLSYGTTEISGGTITATVQTLSKSIAYGVCTLGGTTTIKSGANITANAPTKAYGVYCSGANGDSNRGWPHLGNVNIQGGTITANTTNTTIAYGLYVTGATWTINKSNSYSVFNGDYASAGTATVTGGTFYANAKTTDAGGILVDNTVTKNDASATPVCTINGGYYQATGTGTLNGCAGTALPANFQINGGYYSHDGNLATYAVAPKQVVSLPKTDANYDPYYYKVAEAYTVTFMNGTEQLQSGYQQVGTTPVYEGATPTKASDTKSYIFDGWSTTDGGSLMNPLPNVTSAGATYYAHFAETTLKYIVTFDAKTNGGNEEAQVLYVIPEAAVGTLPTATKTGYTFNGWFTAASTGTQITTTTIPTSDVTYYAQFTVNSHTLTWDLAGGKVSTAGKIGSTTWPAKNATGTPSTSVAYGTILTTIPVVAKTGYTFNRWDPIPGSSMPDNDVTYTALWNPNTNTAYSVKHYLQNVDGTYPADPTETQSLTGTTATSVTPAVKSYEGFVSPSAQTVTIAADGSTVVTYQYARRHYTFTLDAATNGGTSDVPSIEVIHGATIGAVPPDAQKGCNDFTGWYTKAVGGVKITSAFVIEYDMKTLYAQFSDDIRTYPITYLPGENGTGAVAAETKTCGVNTTLSSSTFTRTGYTQTGWSTTDGGTKTYELGGAYTANAAVTLYPFWTINQYTISFNSAGGSAVASITQDYNTAVTAPANPTKTGYTFAGWTPAVPNPMPAEDTECVAQWTANNYAITYKDQGNVAFSGVHGDGYPTTHTYGTATALVNPTKTGYTFEGWYTASDCASGLVTGLDATAYTADITLYAKWTANTYEVTLDPRSGSGGSTSVTMTFNSAEHAAITNPTRTGYTFHSWNTTTSSSTRKIVISSKGVLSENVAGYTGADGVWIRTTMPTTLYARWTENTYAITFTHNGNGSISFNGSVVAAGSTAKVYYHTAKALVATPNTGYHFTGWTKSGTNASKVTIADMSAASTTIKATAKNATVTAGFAPDEYTITYKDQGDVVFSGVHGDGYPTTHTYGTATALVDPTKTGYTFAGWYDNADCTGTALTEIGATAYTASFTLYAKWTPNTNTAYTVKHYQQNLDGTYPEEPTDTDNETGTTDTEVTPAVKNYPGFTAPDAQTVTVLADGSRVVTYQYMRNSYNLTWNSNGGELSGSYTSGLVLFGTTITAPTATRANYDFDGWDEEPAATMPAEDKTYTAQWSLSAVTILWKSEDGSETLETDGEVLIGATPSFDGTTPAKATTAEYTYTFDGWTTEANGSGTFYAIGELPTVSSAATYYAHFTATANVASVKVGSTTTYYTTLQDAFNYAKDKATPTITVLTDITLAAKVTYTNTSKTTVTFDLNGHTVSGGLNPLLTLTSGSSTGGLIIIKSGVAGGQIRNTVNTTGARSCVVLSKGKLRLESGTIYIKNGSTGSSYAVNVASGKTFTMTGGTLEAEGKKNVYALYTAGTSNISGGTIKVTQTTANGYAAGVHVINGTTTITNSPTIMVSGTKYVNGVRVGGLTPAINSAKTSVTRYNAVANIEGGTYTVTASTNTAYGVYCYGNTFKVDYATSSTVPGNYACAGTANVSGGEFTVTSSGSTAYGVCLQEPTSIQTALDADGNATYDAATTNPKATITGGKFKVSGTSSVGAVNTAASNTALDIRGGWYNIDTNLSGYVAPTKDCNYYCLATTAADKATVGSDYNYKVVEIIDIGDRLDIIDWTTTTLTINANGWAASGWPYTINGTPYEKEARAADRTLTIPYSAEAGTDLRIRVQSGGSLTSLHYYTVPFIGTTEGAGEEDVVYVNEGTLTISSNTTLAALYIRPEASVEVTSGTLTVGKLVMRTLPWQAAAISGNFTASETWYTRIAPNKRTITGPYAPITYESARYYQFALPRACTAKLKDIQVSNAANTPYGNTWLLKRYNEETRAEKGIGEANWVALGNEEYIQGGVGYEMFSNSNYYREFYFPLGAVSSASLGNTTAVSYDMGAAGEKHAGWNWVSSPLMSVYDNSDADPEEGMKIGILMTDGSYDQGVPEYIYPAIPFSYQASEGQSVISFEGSSIVAAAPQRRAAADESVRKQWIHVNIQDEDGIGDHTSILAHPTRYEQTYKTGIDVAKQSFTASRPLIYSSHTYGEMAFAAVADSLLEIGIPLTVYSPKPQELTISMRDNNWLDRLAEVWLVDMETGAQTDLFDSDYTFEATEGTTRGRIFLMGRFKAPNIATDIETTEANEDQNMKAQKLIIRDKLYIRLNGQLYDATGKLVNDK